MKEAEQTQKPLTSYSVTLNRKQTTQLKKHLEEKGYQLREVPHSFFGATLDNVSLCLYRSGKLLIQGKGTRDFVEFFLEPEVLKKIRLGYEDILDKFQGERIGVDESGKGDYFGPLVIAGVFVNEEIEKKLKALNVRDSKKISDRRIQELRKVIRRDCRYSVVAIGPERYNQLYDTMENMNRILAWGHARVIENILGKTTCKRAVLDQFGRKDLVLSALMKKGRNIEVVQKTKGESDLAVAAASVLARGEFVVRLKKLSNEFEVKLPAGSSKKAVIQTAQAVIKKWGMEALVRVAKIHFKTTKEILSSS